MPQAQVRGCPELTGLIRMRHSVAAMRCASVAVIVVQMIAAEGICESKDALVSRQDFLGDRFRTGDLRGRVRRGAFGDPRFRRWGFLRHVSSSPQHIVRNQQNSKVAAKQT